MQRRLVPAVAIPSNLLFLVRTLCLVLHTLSYCRIGGSSVRTYAEISIMANVAVAGIVSVSPSSGTALTTSFKVSAANFIDDAEIFLFNMVCVRKYLMYMLADLNALMKEAIGDTPYEL